MADPVMIAAVSVGEFLTDDGEKAINYPLRDTSIENAIGLLTVTLDRLREEAKYSWGTCPACGEDWEDHDNEDEEED